MFRTAWLDQGFGIACNGSANVLDLLIAQPGSQGCQGLVKNHIRVEPAPAGQIGADVPESRIRVVPAEEGAKGLNGPDLMQRLALTFVKKAWIDRVCQKASPALAYAASGDFIEPQTHRVCHL